MSMSKKAVATQRGKGRPAHDTQGVGRQSLVDATTSLLRKRSIDEITRAQLSREAGIDASLIRYYFTNLSSLLTEGMHNLFTELQSRRATMAADASLQAQLRHKIKNLVEVLEEHPFLHQLLMRPVMHVEPEKAEEVEALRRDYTLQSLETFRSMLSHGAATGEGGTTDVSLLYILVVGIAEFAAKCPQYFDLLDVAKGTHEETMAHYIDFAADVLVNGLRPRNEPAGQPGAPVAAEPVARKPRRR